VSRPALSDRQRGTLLSVSAYLIWGFAGLYWIQTQPVDARDLLAHRVIWSVPFVMASLAIAGRGRLVAALALLRQPRTVAVLACSACCSATNWLIFLWAVTNEHATEAALGYFLLPLVNVAIGLTLFRERIDRAQAIGIGFALVAVLVQFVHYGGLPLVALSLALSFGLYGAIRKWVHVESMEGLLLETLLMAPFALAWFFYRDGAGLGQHEGSVDMFLLGAGAMTALPLMAYVAASRLLPLTALGLVFYIGPTSQLLVALLVFREPFDLVQALAFGLVWTGLLVVTWDSIGRARALRRRLGKSV
jgi:chloramphenicol-sensitive protein RarD